MQRLIMCARCGQQFESKSQRCRYNLVGIGVICPACFAKLMVDDYAQSVSDTESPITIQLADPDDGDPQA